MTVMAAVVAVMTVVAVMAVMTMVSVVAMTVRMAGMVMSMRIVTRMRGGGDGRERHGEGQSRRRDNLFQHIFLLEMFVDPRKDEDRRAGCHGQDEHNPNEPTEPPRRKRGRRPT